MNEPVKAGFSGLVWLIIVVIAVVSEMMKAAARAGRPPAKDDGEAWGSPSPDAKDPGTLDQRIAEYLERVRAAGQAKTAQAAARRGTPPPPAPPVRRTTAAALVRPQAARRASRGVSAIPQKAIPTREPPPMPTPAPRLARTSAAVSVVPSAPDAPPLSPSHRSEGPQRSVPADALRAALRADLRRADSLQRALVLREILGPPRALHSFR